MLFIKVHKKDAENARVKLINENVLSKEYKAFSEEDFVFFPVIQPIDGYTLIKRRGTKTVKGKKIKDVLGEEISSFDLIGEAAIVEIPEKLSDKEKEIADAIMKVHKNVKSVFRKMSAMEGEFRVRKLKCVGGSSNTEVSYKEYGCSMRLDIAQVYFSPRLSNERERIAKLVKGEENVLVMFAGVGPFAIIIGKKNPKAKIIAIELNPVAVSYMKQNIKRNKLRNIQVIEGDVNLVSPRNCADRICMPLPHSACDFLDIAFASAKNNCVIHFYAMVDLKDMPDKVLDLIKKAAKRNGVEIEIMNWKIVRPYAPKVNQIVVDFKVYKKIV